MTLAPTASNSAAPATDGSAVRIDRMTEETAGVPQVLFPRGLPGFPGAQHFVLVRIGEEGSLFSALRCVDEELEFVVVPPHEFFPEYAPELDDDTVALLGLETADDALLLAIVTLADAIEDSTANLLGPIVVNRHTQNAVQAVLSERWSTRHRLLPDAG